MSPEMSAAICARKPATIATTPLPQEHMLKVLARSSSGKPLRRCSVTIQDSKAENSSEVDTPPSTLPIKAV